MSCSNISGGRSATLVKTGKSELGHALLGIGTVTDLEARDDTEKLRSEKPFQDKESPNPNGDAFHNGGANGHHVTNGRPESSEV